MIHVIGAGISGLTAAVRLQRAGTEVVVWERADRPGGAVATVRQGGWRFERGPNSLQLSHPALADFVARSGLEQARLTADRAAARRYVVAGGRPVALPSSPWGAVSTPLLPLAAKLRVLREPWVPRRTGSGAESVGDMVRRRLGADVLEALVDAMVGGIFAGDPDRLDVRYALPKLWRLEQEHGSFIRGAFAKKKTGPSSTIISFEDGLAQLPETLAAELGPNLRLGTPALIERDGSAFRVNGEPAERILVTAPVPAWPSLFGSGIDTSALPTMTYAPVATVSFGFRKTDVLHPADGFGLLVPRRERLDILGTLFPSTIFPGRAPEGHHLLTTFVGGMRNPELVGLDEEALTALVLRNLDGLLGLEGSPVASCITRWPAAIPQYDMEHERFLLDLETFERNHPGLRFQGNFRGGIGLDSCLKNALEA